MRISALNKIGAHYKNIKKNANLLTNLHHDLQTPLNAIIGFSELMLKGIYGNLDNPKYLEYTNDINTAGNSLSYLINLITDFAKINTDEFSMHITKINLYKMLNRCINAVNSEAQNKKINIINDIAIANSPIIITDIKLVKQVLTTFLSLFIDLITSTGKIIIAHQQVAKNDKITFLLYADYSQKLRDLFNNRISNDLINNIHDIHSLKLGLCFNILKLIKWEFDVDFNKSNIAVINLFIKFRTTAT